MVNDKSHIGIKYWQLITFVCVVGSVFYFFIGPSDIRNTGYTEGGVLSLFYAVIQCVSLILAFFICKINITSQQLYFKNLVVCFLVSLGIAAIASILFRDVISESLIQSLGLDYTVSYRLWDFISLLASILMLTTLLFGLGALLLLVEHTPKKDYTAKNGIEQYTYKGEDKIEIIGRNKNESLFLDPNNFISVESSGHYIKIEFIDSDVVRVKTFRNSMTEVKSQLKAQNMKDIFSLSRSALINLHMVSSIESRKKQVLLKKSFRVLSIPADNVQALLNRWDHFENEQRKIV